ncbi:cAMP-dependent protein kinase type II regulatory subunit-like isoform X1 [Limulus polyphemus]|uniref:cAMP-dependent protein kinase type II regulatory subunit-like isoform X1 n=1 Tax=Limulus polyphemus TaxID=6850 RepID=A0ABM1SQB8_LIMPO|nr:cAMP-dependent protein kinase type II regulatory subunit-like isoform X1 [Limulus polyphemus]
MSRSRVEVPPELTSLLLEFTVSILTEKPEDIVDYAVNYFTKIRDEKRKTSSGIVQPSSSVSVTTPLIVEDITEGNQLQEPPNRFVRRKSVFAEQYDPAEDEDDDNEKAVYPKTEEQRQRLEESVQNILLFRSLDEQQMRKVLDAMFEKKVEPGQVVIKQGDDGDYFYVIQNGIYSIYVSTEEENRKMIGTYENSGSFGELALMYNMPRAATIEAITPGSLWAMSRQVFRKIVLKSAFKKRKEYETLLEKVPMLESLEPYERMNLCDALMPKTYQDGELIIRQGDVADGMYFVEEGMVRIVMQSDSDEEKELLRLTKGQYFGELALVTHKPRAASAFAIGSVRLAFLDVLAFERLLGPCMDIIKRNIDQYEEQLINVFGSKNDISDLR